MVRIFEDFYVPAIKLFQFEIDFFWLQIITLVLPQHVLLLLLLLEFYKIHYTLQNMPHVFPSLAFSLNILDI